jgi:ankyrin repeat protein
MASVELLVEDIWFSIFDLLPLHSKLLVAQVSKHLCSVARHPSHWTKVEVSFEGQYLDGEEKKNQLLSFFSFLRNCTSVSDLCVNFGIENSGLSVGDMGDDFKEQLKPYLESVFVIPTLRRVCLVDFQSFLATRCGTVHPKCKELRILNLSSMPMYEANLSSLLSGLPNLEELYLSPDSVIGPTSAQLLERLPKLRILSVPDIPSPTFKSPALQFLVVLNLSRFSFLNDKSHAANSVAVPKAVFSRSLFKGPVSELKRLAPLLHQQYTEDDTTATVLTYLMYNYKRFKPAIHFLVNELQFDLNLIPTEVTYRPSFYHGLHSVTEKFPLEVALSRGDVDQVLDLLRLGAKAECPIHGRSYLEYRCDNQTYWLLLQYGADPNKLVDGHPVFVKIFDTMDCEDWSGVFEALIGKIDVNYVMDGQSVLELAIPEWSTYNTLLKAGAKFTAGVVEKLLQHDCSKVIELLTENKLTADLFSVRSAAYAVTKGLAKYPAMEEILKALKAKQDDDGMTVLHYVCLDYEEKGIAMDTSDDDESLNRWETTDIQLEFKNKRVVKPKKRSPQKFDGSPKKEYFADKKPATKEKKGYSYSKKKAVESDKKVKKESYRPDLTFKEQPQAFAFGNKMKKENNQTSFTYNKSDFNNYELQNAFALENKAKKEGNQTSFTFNQPSFTFNQQPQPFAFENKEKKESNQTSFTFNQPSFTFNQPSFTFNDQPQPFDNKEKKESNQTSFTFNQQPQPFAFVQTQHNTGVATNPFSFSNSQTNNNNNNTNFFYSFGESSSSSSTTSTTNRTFVNPFATSTTSPFANNTFASFSSAPEPQLVDKSKDIATQIKLVTGDINATNKVGETPLLLAIKSRLAENKKIAKLTALLEQNPDVNKADKNGWTPLHAACYVGHHKIAALLLSHGADINAQDKEGVTPLMAAVYGTAGHNRVSANGIAALLEGIDASKIDFTLTEKRSRRNLLHFMVCLANMSNIIPKNLGNKNCDVNARDFDGYTPLHYALMFGRFELIPVLQNYGADFNAQTYGMRLTPAMLLLHMISVESPYNACLENSNLFLVGKSSKRVYASTDEELECTVIEAPWNCTKSPRRAGKQSITLPNVMSCVLDLLSASNFDLVDGRGNTYLHMLVMCAGAHCLDFDRWVNVLVPRLSAHWTRKNYDDESPLLLMCKQATYTHPDSKGQINLLNIITQFKLDFTTPNTRGESPIGYITKTSSFWRSTAAWLSLPGFDLTLKKQSTGSDLWEVMWDEQHLMSKDLVNQLIAGNPQVLITLGSTKKKTLLMLVLELILADNITGELSPRDTLEYTKILFKCLLPHKPHLNVQDVNGNTALHMACQYFNFGAVDTKRNCITNAQSFIYMRIVFTLLDAGADPSIKNNLGLSPLDNAPHLMELYAKDVRSWLMDDYTKEEEDSDRPQKNKARKAVKKVAKKPRSRMVKRAASSSSSDSDSSSG